MIPFSDSRFPGNAKPGHFQLILRRRPDGTLPDFDLSVREELSQIIDYLEAMRTSIEEGKPHPTVPPRLSLPGQRDFHSKRLKAIRVRLGSKVDEEPSADEESSPQDLSLLTDNALFAESGPRTIYPAWSAAPGRYGKWLSVLAGVVLLAALGAVALFWTRHTPAPRDDAPAREENVSARAVRTADIVLQAIQGGRFEEASRLLADAQKDRLHLPGLRYQFALLAQRQGDEGTSVRWIEQSIAAHESVPECLYLRAEQNAATGDYAGASENLEKAAAHTAFSPRYFFFWGEMLRRYGHPTQATLQFERALRCNPEAADAELIQFKMGLAQIEAGANETLAARLESALAEKPVPADACLLAMAVEINRAAYANAAVYLQRAKETMPPTLLALRLRDFFFQNQTHQPALAAVWPAAEPARGRVIVDPATRSLAEADPAAW